MFFKIKIFFPVLLLLISLKLSAVKDNYPSGARASALSNAGVVLIDTWANYHNQACLAFVEDLSIGFHWENKYVVDQFSQSAFALTIPVNGGTIGANYSFFGYSKYNESKFGLAFGKSFGDYFGAGIQLDLINVFQSSDYGNVMALVVEGGIIAKPARNLLIGAHVFNPNMSGFKQLEEEIPTILQLGAGYRVNEKLFFITEVEKNLEDKPVCIIGTEYQLVNIVKARIAVTTSKLSVYSFGLGFNYSRVNADIAFSHHQILGFTPHISFIYNFGKRTQKKKVDIPEGSDNTTP